MPTVRFSQEDFLRSKVMKPGWYHALIKSVPVKPAKSDGSDVYNPQLKIVEPGEFNGVPVQDYISEKALSIGGIRFVRACLGKDPSPDQSYDLGNGVGKVVKVHISNNLYQGRVQNQIDDYDYPDAGFKVEAE